MDPFGKSPVSRAQASLSMLGVENARAQLQLVRSLKRTRQASGLSVQSVADSMGVDASMVYRFEQGGTNFTMSTLRAYADAIDVRLELSASPRCEG